jgi:hypothetical protein
MYNRSQVESFHMHENNPIVNYKIVNHGTFLKISKKAKEASTGKLQPQASIPR